MYSEPLTGVRHATIPANRQQRGEYLLLLGDSMDRDGLRDYCEHHGTQYGSQYQLVFHNNDSVESMMGYVCTNRFGDLITLGHLYNSGVNETDSSNFEVDNVSTETAGSTLLRIRKALIHFRQKFKRNPDKVLLHTTNWDRRYLQYSTYFDKSRYDLDTTFTEDDGFLPFYNNFKYLIRFTRNILKRLESGEKVHVHEEPEPLERVNSDRGTESHIFDSFNGNNGTIGSKRTHNSPTTRIILRSAPIPTLGEVERTTNVTMEYFNAATKLLAQEENLEYYDLDGDMWSVAEYQCSCRQYQYHRLIFYDDIHPNRVLASRYIEKILGL